MKFYLILLLITLSLPGLCQEEGGVEQPSFESSPTSESFEQNPQEPTYNPHAELLKLGYTTIDVKALTDERVVKIVKRMLQESQLHQAPPEDIKNLILERAKGSWFHDFLVKRPKLLNAFVDIMRDKEALPSAVGIFQKQKELKNYFFVWLGLMIAAFIYKKATFKKNWSRPKTMLMSALVSIVVTTVSLTTFYQMFYDEISPAANILVQHWRKRNL